MKKTTRTILSLVLAVLLALSCVSVSFSASSDRTPVILIPGFGQSETNVYDDDGSYLGEINSFNIETLDVKEIIFDIILPAFKSIISRKDVDLSTAAAEEMQKIFKPYIKNNDGSYRYETIVREFNTSYSQATADEKQALNIHVDMGDLAAFNDLRYYFTYDTFGSIKTAADRLHTFLHDVVLAQSGASKVTFVPISQGGTVFQEFIELYPEDYQYIKKIIGFVPAYDGSVLMTDIVNDNVTVYDIDYVHETVLPALLGETDAAYAASLALRFGLTGDMLVKVIKAALPAALDCLLVKSTSMWALCPTESFEFAMDKFVSDPALSAVREECMGYLQARNNYRGHLQELMDSGVVVHNIVAYDGDMMFGFLFGSYNEKDCDELLSPASSSLGATVAPKGKTLGDDYVSAHTYCSDPTHNHISPDGKIDASTGFLPENTWYFRSVRHSQLNWHKDIKDFTVQLALDDSITDIYSTDIFSQFTTPSDYVDSVTVSGNYAYYYDADGNLLYYSTLEDYEKEHPEESQSGDASPSFIAILYKIVNFIFKVLSTLGIKIKGF